MLAKGGAIIYPTIFVDDSDIRPPQGQDIGSDRFLTPLEAMRQRAESDAGTHGYYLNSDPDFLGSLLGGLKTNEERYGYSSC
ncbi:MAG: ferredoxin-thioredoxin reductase catalytic domain-containing protein, partial [Dehalococcoidia bacterium]|nr:ferredoxin-thioredoxin reductase catalytic domain-containing protein [Dehalococcoidia bacterium]